jgi:hypothetical protein
LLGSRKKPETMLREMLEKPHRTSAFSAYYPDAPTGRFVGRVVDRRIFFIDDQ